MAQLLETTSDAGYSLEKVACFRRDEVLSEVKVEIY